MMLFSFCARLVSSTQSTSTSTYNSRSSTTQVLEPIDWILQHRNS